MHRQACSSAEQLFVHELLYFGTAKPQGIVSPEEWAEFLSATVTPRFPQGLSVWQTSGQWRGADGVVIREASYVLNILHADNATDENAVREIVAYWPALIPREEIETKVSLLE